MCYHHVEEIELLKSYIHRLIESNKELMNVSRKFAESTLGIAISHGYGFDYESLSNQFKKTIDLLEELKDV